MIARLAALLSRPRSGARWCPRAAAPAGPAACAAAPGGSQGPRAAVLPVELQQLVAVAAAFAPASAPRLLAHVQLGEGLARAVNREVRALAAGPRDARVGAVLRVLGPPPRAPVGSPLLGRLLRELDASPASAPPLGTRVRRAAPESAARSLARARALEAQAHAAVATRVWDGRTLVRARHGA